MATGSVRRTDFRDDIVLQVYDFEAAAVLIQKLNLLNLELSANETQRMVR